MATALHDVQSADIGSTVVGFEGRSGVAGKPLDAAELEPPFTR